jgi:hypothetical protein
MAKLGPTIGGGQHFHPAEWMDSHKLAEKIGEEIKRQFDLFIEQEKKPPEDRTNFSGL